MFDNLRELSEEPLYEDNADDLFKNIEEAEAPAAAPAPKSRKRKSKSKRFLGMTAQQRFILSVMLMLSVCVVGTLVMFLLGRMSIF